MNNITARLATVFTDKQIQAMKDAWKFGAWGDCEVEFAGIDAGALGCCTNDIYKGGHFTRRQVAGIMSGISKRIDKTNTAMVKCCSDWWGDGSGDMFFFNLNAFDFNNSTDAWDAFNEWSVEK